MEKLAECSAENGSSAPLKRIAGARRKGSPRIILPYSGALKRVFGGRRRGGEKADRWKIGEKEADWIFLGRMKGWPLTIGGNQN